MQDEARRILAERGQSAQFHYLKQQADTLIELGNRSKRETKRADRGNQRGRSPLCVGCGTRQGVSIFVTWGALPDGRLKVFAFCADRCRDRWYADNPFRPG